MRRPDSEHIDLSPERKVMFSKDLLSAASFSPSYLVDPKGWIGHIPFAAWLIKQIKPQIFVELGTHSGNSYFSFCQAVAELGLSSRCFAVDSWQGDEQAGYYGDEIFEQVDSNNQSNYADFSQLLRMTFDEAVEQFGDGTIDVLHIDGLHTYEAVRHDFETWLPKLSPQAVVLFHDTAVHDEGFGVWRFWKQLQSKYSDHFEFDHCNGLGVLQLLPPKSDSPFTWSALNHIQETEIKSFFSVLGDRLINRFNLELLHQRFEERGDYVDTLNHALEQSAQGVSELKLALGESHRALEQSAEGISELRQALSETRQVVSAQQHQLSVLSENIDQLISEKMELEKLYSDIVHSTAWKVTFPFRRLLENHPFLRRYSRKIASVLWWAVTGKLRQRLREHRCKKKFVHDCDPISTPNFIPTIREVARPIEIDYSLAVPFETNVGDQLSSSPRLAVICHLYYEELASEIRSYLKNIPFSFDLYISTDSLSKKTVIEKVFTDWSLGQIEVRVMDNCGRDIAPKLIGFADIYSGYEYVLHLHSKRSHHADVLANWRGSIFENLLGSPQIVRSIFTAFEQQSDLGIVAAQHFEPVRHWINWGGNYSEAQKLAHRMGINLNDKHVLDFPSGSMFWARCAALRPLLDLNLSLDDFTEEAGQIDGTLAHAIERLYYFVCEKAGYQWVKIADPRLYEQTPSIISLTVEENLASYFRKYGLTLTGDTLPEPRKTHPQPIALTAPALVSRLQERALGETLSLSADTAVTVGVVTYNTNQAMLDRIVKSSIVALERAGLSGIGKILLLDNGESTEGILDPCQAVKYLPSCGNIGFGAAHNLLMDHAFNDGADVYIATNPDGAFHPSAIMSLLKMMQAHEGRALVEAIQFPAEHPKPYDPFTFETPWVSGACLAISRSAFEELGGFDPCFFMYCEDVDLSWRAKASGFALRTCPNALFLHEVTNRTRDEAVLKMILTSGVLLARKWGSQSFESWLKVELSALGQQLPKISPEPVPADWQRYADFSHQFSFSKGRW